MSAVKKSFYNSLERSGCQDIIIEMRFQQNRTLAEIAQYLKENVKEFSGFSVKSLIVDLSKFFKNIEEMGLENVKTQKLENELNELEELAKLYKLQKARITMSFEKEKELNETTHQTSIDVLYALKILDRSAQLKMDMGLLKRDLGRIEINNKMIGIMASLPPEHDRYKHVLFNPESRRRILSVLDKIMRLVNKNSLPEAEEPKVIEIPKAKDETGDK
jgi:hypothetical protein